MPVYFQWIENGNKMVFEMAKDTIQLPNPSELGQGLIPNGCNRCYGSRCMEYLLRTPPKYPNPKRNIILTFLERQWEKQEQRISMVISSLPN